MRAFIYNQYGSPENLQLDEVSKPIPEDDEVLVKVEAISLNPADWRLLRGIPFLVRLETGLFKPKAKILGADLAGRVEAVGPNVTQFKPGDAVFGDISTGAFAEYACAKEEKLAPKPSNLSFEEAAAIPLAAITTLQGIRDKGELQPNQTVLINGASGGVGSYAVQIAKSFGATVTGVCSTKNVDLVRSLGADHVVDYTQDDFTQTGCTYDLILDIVGNRTVADFQRTLAPEGRCVLIGFSTISHMLLTSLIEDGKLKPVIDRCYRFEELPQGIQYLESGRARGKVVVKMGAAL